MSIVRAFGLVLLVLVTLGLPALAGDDGERVVRVPYDLGPPGPFASVQVPNPTPYEDGRDLRIGGTAVRRALGETHLEVFLLDSTARKVPGRVVFLDADDQQIELDDFCFELAREIPPATIEVAVHPSVLVTPCQPAGLNYGPAVNGEMVLVFT